MNFSRISIFPRISSFPRIRARQFFFFLFVFLVSLNPLSVPAQPEPDVEALRKQLQKLQQQRREQAEMRRDPLIPFADTRETLADFNPRAHAAVRIANEMPRLRGLLIFTPLAAAGASTDSLRLLLCHDHPEWIALPPGEWRVTLYAGLPGRTPAKEIDRREIELRPGRGHAIVFTKTLEEKLLSLLQTEGQNPTVSDPDLDPERTPIPFGSVTTPLKLPE